ncbi:multicopper oxidase family protein [Shimia abyssi]|uniref:FtsP/CotA-like multicopper oxidase with cupredoxin domain n=1 Tax=Shimia abyssi TaxID=1662395 RepID=A0A2P8FAJ2_9RHOB|nr:multicopper oxidase family protein [Shimia abyssi]PSL18724.1 FtsP/CotA-like multicopper oxidase with cupredoxin domain [Shimia abyssi]
MTRLTRRTLLKSATAALALPAFARASGHETLLHAQPASAQLVDPEYPPTKVWCYNGAVPGTQLRAQQGDILNVRLRNGIDQSTSIHWHGLRVRNDMDGVPGFTQDPVQPGEDFLYDLALRDAGTYWYHSHSRSFEQVARGLYGALIIEEPDAPEVDYDLTVVLDDWRLTETAQISDDFENRHDLSHAGRLGNYIHAVFDAAPAQFRKHERLRLRFINTATNRIMPVSLRGVDGWIVARDGMPLTAPEPLATLTLGPAERADVIVDVTAETGGEVLLVFQDRDQGYVLNEFPVATGATTRRAAPKALSPNPITRLTTVENARTIPLRMEGGAMSGLQAGRYQGRDLSMRELVGQGQMWTLSGVASFPEAPFFDASLGETIVLQMKNDTAFPHAMHMHGMHFQEVLSDGFGPHKDTVLLAPSEARDFAFVADNPGKWLLHCHMLSHSQAGMKTWFQVG